jgi:oxygen-dependent protoporphyrinogen oxidase
MKVIIIGAGISGLSLGWFLKNKFGSELNLSILEASDRAGGWIRSHFDQGFLFEEGPRSCRSKGAGTATLQLIEELGLCDEVISASPVAKQRFIYWDSRLQPLPNTIMSFIFSPLMKGVFPALWKEWRIPPGNFEDESIADFTERRLGKEVTEKFMDSLVSGIYAGDIHKLSLRSCFPEMHLREQAHGSLLKGFLKKKKVYEEFSPFVKLLKSQPIFSFKQGMETLPLALAANLKEYIHLSCYVESILIEEAAVKVYTSKAILKADRVYLAIPAQAASKLIKKCSEIAAEDMSKQISTTVAVVNMGWSNKVLNHEGFGYLVPSCQKQKILGVVFDSSAFAMQNKQKEETRLTVMLGGRHHPEVEDYTKEKVSKIAFDAVKNHLNIKASPNAMKVSIAKQAIPQYEIGHLARLKRIEAELQEASNSRVFLVGSAWRGVAVNDCIAEAKQITREFRF